MEAFIAWLNEPLVQSMIVSPLIGALLGALLGGLTRPPPSTSSTTVQEATIIFQQTIVVKQRGGGPASQEDGWVYLFGLIAIAASVTWGYSRYAHEILNYWLSGLFFCTAFILSAGIASIACERYNSAEWIRYIFTPLVAVGISFYLVHLAQSGIITGAREAAYRYGLLDFYFNVLKNEHRMWLLLQVTGALFGIIATLAATLRSVHYLALMNQRMHGLSSLWYSLARATLFATRRGSVVLLVLTTGAAYFMLSGNAYELWESRN